jgi:hypothetical protein
MCLLVAPRELLTVTSGYGASCIFYTDGSLIEGCAGFAVHQMGVGGFGYKIPSPAGVFTAELSALFTARQGTTDGIGRIHLRQTIISEQFPEFGETGIDESMSGQMGLYGYW